MLFEAGMFIGMHGPKRTFIVAPQGYPDFHMPSDLLGVTTATYDPNYAVDDPKSALGGAVFEISEAMNKVLAGQDDIHVTARCLYNATAVWKMKLVMQVSNRRHTPVTVFSESFLFTAEAPPSKMDSVLRDGTHRPAFLIERQGPKVPQDRYSAWCVIEPGQAVEAWVDFDDAIGEVTFSQLRNASKLGRWKYRCIWHHHPPFAHAYERPF